MTYPIPGLSYAWLVRLRWITVAAQAAAILLAARLLPGALPVPALLGLVAAGAASNAALAWFLRRPEPPPRHLPGAALALDILLLTGLLYGSGGPANPFTALYLVQITLAAVVMRGGWAWGLSLLAASGYGLLFFWNVHVHALGHMDHGGQGMSLHLLGMWVAFAITASLIAMFVGKVTEALRTREEDLARLRERDARHAKLAALTTLAAGVAHELGSPLGTIAVAAGELQREAEAMGRPGEALAGDAALIRREVHRCRGILDQMADPSGALFGEDPRPVAWGEVAALVAAQAPPEVRFEVPAGTAGPLPVQGLVRTLRALLANALEACPEPGGILVRAWEEPGAWNLEVVDRGRGMAPEVLARAGDPFFTTKEAGEGMGLGLFLARTFAEQLGGGLTLQSSPGAGTRVRMRWPGHG
ncbi:sensor histidine kinase [Mesoterricola silvestris]|uniref:histidine kinase n=1 Tax=Mesoterricola silvestris TaxID=2927979 RepID=A0AA48K916_9BACT|nr:HAMP domain-containing sensor histidine kinase [Mesoterricola silvestris]BDU71857.1 two-component sensor histidine kinase [Mesoterricola silvestris]